MANLLAGVPLTLKDGREVNASDHLRGKVSQFAKNRFFDFSDLCFNHFISVCHYKPANGNFTAESTKNLQTQFLDCRPVFFSVLVPPLQGLLSIHQSRELQIMKS